MDSEKILQKALMRYQVISPYLAADPPHGQRYKLIEELASKQWILEGGGLFEVQPETIRKWIRLYNTQGFDGLKDTPRKNIGIRSIPQELIEEACRLKKEVPERGIEQIIRIMETTAKAPKGMIKRSTLHRALQARGLSGRKARHPEDKNLHRFQADYANDLWQADMLTGPWLPDPDRPDKHRRAYLYAFLDDASRLVPYGRFSFKGDLPCLELVMKRAIQRYGCPRRVYYDNAMVFRSNKMSQICASLGMHRTIFTAPYRPEGHGKIEAFNRSCRSRFIAEVKASSIDTLDQLNEAFLAWLDQDYNKRTHTELAICPYERWNQDTDRIRYVDEEKIRRAFLFKLDRTTDKCAVFKLHGLRYQVGWELAKKKIQVHYDPEHLEQVEVFRDGKFAERAKPLTITPYRPSQKPKDTPPSHKPQNSLTDYLGCLVQRYHQQMPSPETDPPNNQADAFVAMIKDLLAEEIFDETAVLDFWDRFGPFDLRHSENILKDLLEVHPTTYHIHFYLEAISKKGV
jgi:transposase InsO family protein